MPHVTAHRSSTRRPALAGLVALTVFATLALIGAPAFSLPTADDDTDFHISSDIVIKEDNTFSVKLTMSESGSIPALSKSMCNKDSSTVKDSPYDDFKVKFVEKDGTRTCTMEGTDSISTSSKNIKHEGDEYIVQTLNFDSISDEDVTEISQSVTFPGKVTEADGGTVEGTKVSFKDNDKHEVKGKDKPAKSAAAEEDSSSTPVWIWSLIGSLAVAIVGGVVGVLVMNQRKKKQSQLVAYAAAAQFYDPNQAPLGQPGQQPYQPGYAEPYQPGQPTPQPYQPGYTEPATQPYQQAQPYQPGYTDPATQPYQQAQPYQPGYAEPYQQGQPTSQPYQVGQPGQQLYQPGYTEPAARPYQPGQPTSQPYQQAQPYQPPYTDQPGQPGPRF
ncbi:LppM family (lipo)protein [Actinomyces oris]|uniref:LppM family (lipo)protein n=1 Tax=Actinomyces oris TaxID=544580 RepID=UPI0022FD633F|nr:viral protein TPX [Actinomyces oris]WCA43031.1 viral protein TPX [Actinomyces oris]